jgi:hypothetical protein
MKSTWTASRVTLTMLFRLKELTVRHTGLICWQNAPENTGLSSAPVSAEAPAVASSLHCRDPLG